MSKNGLYDYFKIIFNNKYNRSCNFSTNVKANRIRRTSHIDHQNYFNQRRIIHIFRNSFIKAISNNKLQKNSKGDARIFAISSILFVFLVCSTILIYFEKYEPTLKELTNTAANLLLRNSKVHETAVQFTKSVIMDVLNNKEIQESVNNRVKDILLNSQSDVEILLLKSLSSKETLRIVNDMARIVINDMCNDENVQEKVGYLLLQSIKTKTAVEGAAKWVVDLTTREDIIESLNILVSQRLFGDKFLQTEALNFCKDVLNDLFVDEGTIQGSVDFIKSVLERQEVQSRMAQSLWDVFKLTVYPRWMLAENRGQLPSVQPINVDSVLDSNEVPFFY